MYLHNYFAVLAFSQFDIVTDSPPAHIVFSGNAQCSDDCDNPELTTEIANDNDCRV